MNNLSSVDQGELLFIANLQNQEANFASVLAIIFWFRLVKFLRAMSLFKHNGDKFSLGKRLPLGVLMKITFQVFFFFIFLEKQGIYLPDSHFIKYIIDGE